MPITAEDRTRKVGGLGHQKVLGQLASMMVDFELGFEILPGTKGKAKGEDLNDFEVGPMTPPGE